MEVKDIRRGRFGLWMAVSALGAYLVEAILAIILASIAKLEVFSIYTIGKFMFDIAVKAVIILMLLQALFYTTGLHRKRWNPSVELRKQEGEELQIREYLLAMAASSFLVGLTGYLMMAITIR